MKRYILLVLLVITLCSCVKPGGDTYIGGQTYTFRDRCYYIDHNRICFVSVGTGERGVFCFDPLCGHDSDTCMSFLPIGNFTSLVVDEAASEGNVVIYAAGNYLTQEEMMQQKTEFHSTIFRLDTQTGVRSIVAEDFGCTSVNHLCLQDGNFLFTAWNDEHFAVFRLDSRMQLSTVFSDDNMDMIILDAVGNEIFAADMAGRIFCLKADGTNEHIYDVPFVKGIYIHDGYLYYPDEELRRLNENPDLPYYNSVSGVWETYQWQTISYTYYRVPLSDTGAEPQAVVSNTAAVQGMLLDGDKMYLPEIGYRYLGSFTVYDPELQMELPMYSAVTTEAILCINLETLETERLMTDTCWDVYDIYAYHDGKILFEGVDRQAALDGTGTPMRYVIYDTETDDYIVLEWE